VAATVACGAPLAAERQIVIRTMRLHYDLRDAGWATVTVECGDQRGRDDCVVPARFAPRPSFRGSRVGEGWNRSDGCLMDEPGEHQLALRRINDKDVELEIMWYDDWRSWKMHDGPGRRRLSGKTTVAHVRGQMLSELRRLLHENGEAGYLERWGEHPFPIAEMLDLEEAG
jgi:hypothetical protein